MKDITVSFNGPIEKIITILTAIKNKINANTDVAWSRYDNPRALINDLDSKIKSLQSGDYQVIGDIVVLFAPTGALQEISISNGWSDDFLKLAEQFDDHYKEFKRR